MRTQHPALFERVREHVRSGRFVPVGPVAPVPPGVPGVPCSPGAPCEPVGPRAPVSFVRVEREKSETVRLLFLTLEELTAFFLICLGPTLLRGRLIAA